MIQPQWLEKTALVVALDLSKPWELMSTLEAWVKCLEARVLPAVGELSMGEQDALKGAVLNHVKNYKEPQDENATVTEPQDGDEVEDTPLSTGVLTANWGLPLVVVCCQADVMQSQEREEKDATASERRFDFIQQRLRKFCIKYGAALIFTAAKTGSNCKLLQQYLLHRLYPTNFNFKLKPMPVDRDTLFIPSGYDSLDLIGDAVAPWSDDTPFAEVVTNPNPTAAVDAAAGGAAAGGDADADKEKLAPLEVEQGWLKTLQKLQLLQKDATGSTSFAATDTRRAASAPEAKDPRSPAAGAGGKAEVKTADLQNFFNNLLQRGDKKTATTEADKAVRKNAEKALSGMQKESRGR
jgi:dynein light intermediate chain 1